MTYTPVRYRSYQEYLDDERLAEHGNYRLLDTGELIELASENDDNTLIAIRLLLALCQLPGLQDLVRNGNKEIQVRPVGDRWINRKPDLLVMLPEHRRTAKQAITLDQPPPQLVAEVVSPGAESSDNYLRDYVWKRSQYEKLGIPEYWIVDPHRQRVTVLVLTDGSYEETVFEGDSAIASRCFPELALRTRELLVG